MQQPSSVHHQNANLSNIPQDVHTFARDMASRIGILHYLESGEWWAAPYVLSRTIQSSEISVRNVYGNLNHINKRFKLLTHKDLQRF
ncbi:hypothetical protein LSG31_17635 [Fodinisporobacter ferrooxydans]|uniref:Uncharacterized protein n=1 Tax=Fodinisporobacter ferrooxydans TaxID=2901836 RepID=A0ABY4CPA3_9BACL|nr:hypothetical protein LSG31_17635 [Alicyclobacillaceae bacterium MYW30-H2]